MSGYVQLSAGIPAQSIGEVLSPGIVSLFIQGLETGLVISQLSQWLSLERSEGFAITALVIFVTTIGLSAFTLFLRGFLSHAYVRYILLAWRLLYVLCLHGESMLVILDKL